MNDRPCVGFDPRRDRGIDGLAQPQPKQEPQKKPQISAERRLERQLQRLGKFNKDDLLVLPKVQDELKL